jgi:hypothetical protein
VIAFTSSRLFIGHFLEVIEKTGFEGICAIELMLTGFVVVQSLRPDGLDSTLGFSIVLSLPWSFWFVV